MVFFGEPFIKKDLQVPEGASRPPIKSHNSPGLTKRVSPENEKNNTKTIKITEKAFDYIKIEEKSEIKRQNTK